MGEERQSEQSGSEGGTRSGSTVPNPSWGGVKMQSDKTGSAGSSQERFHFCSSHEGPQQILDFILYHPKPFLGTG